MPIWCKVFWGIKPANPHHLSEIPFLYRKGNRNSPRLNDLPITFILFFNTLAPNSNQSSMSKCKINANNFINDKHLFII